MTVVDGTVPVPDKTETAEKTDKNGGRRSPPPTALVNPRTKTPDDVNLKENSENSVENVENESIKADKGLQRLESIEENKIANHKPVKDTVTVVKLSKNEGAKREEEEVDIDLRPRCGKSCNENSRCL